MQGLTAQGTNLQGFSPQGFSPQGFSPQGLRCSDDPVAWPGGGDGIHGPRLRGPIVVGNEPSGHAASPRSASCQRQFCPSIEPASAPGGTVGHERRQLHQGSGAERRRLSSGGPFGTAVFRLGRDAWEASVSTLRTHLGTRRLTSPGLRRMMTSTYTRSITGTRRRRTVGVCFVPSDERILARLRAMAIPLDLTATGPTPASRARGSRSPARPRAWARSARATGVTSPGRTTPRRASRSSLSTTLA